MVAVATPLVVGGGALCDIAAKPNVSVEVYRARTGSAIFEGVSGMDTAPDMPGMAEMAAERVVDSATVGTKLSAVAKNETSMASLNVKQYMVEAEVE